MQIKYTVIDRKIKNMNITFCCLDLFKDICSDRISIYRVNKPYPNHPATWNDMFQLQHNHKLVNTKKTKHDYCPLCGTAITCTKEDL